MSELFGKEGSFAIGDALKIENAEDPPVDEAQALSVTLNISSGLAHTQKHGSTGK
jgi:hypothetical protein